MATTDISTATPQIGVDRRSKDSPSYAKSIGDKLGPARQLFENYSKIPPEEVEKHVNEIVIIPKIFYMPKSL